MVMCAETPDGKTVEFLQPPPGSEPGDLIFFEGYERNPPAELPGKRWQACVEKFLIDGNQVAVFRDEGKDHAFQTSKGVCKSSTVVNGIVK
jgi:hypothetical protein